MFGYFTSGASVNGNTFEAIPKEGKEKKTNAPNTAPIPMSERQSHQPPHLPTPILTIRF